MRLFLAAHRARLAGIRIEQHGGLLDLAAVLQRVDLPLHFVVDGLLHELERVQVLDLAARAERLAGTAHRHVHVAAERTFLHVAVADADPAHQRMQGFGIGHRLGGRSHVRLGNDLQQRRAGAVQVDAGHAMEIPCSDLPASSSRWARVMRTTFSYGFAFPDSGSTWIVSAPCPTTGRSNWLIW